MIDTRILHGSDVCGPTTGKVTATPAASFDPAFTRARDTWTSGDFGRIAVAYTDGAAAFVDRLSLGEGELVLDVACGTGNLAIPAARSGAFVAGIDIASNLIDAARVASAEAALDIHFDVGTAEAMPYPDATFQTVMSMFGVMFCGRPDDALSELFRVTRRGGRIALASWTPAGFVGDMFRMHAAYVPPPAGAPSSLSWGDEVALQEKLEGFASRIESVRFTKRTMELAFPVSPKGVVDTFRNYYGPSVRTFAALDAPKQAALEQDLVRLWTAHNAASDGATSVHAEYLEVVVQLA